jgi:hypothetical protein
MRDWHDVAARLTVRKPDRKPSVVTNHLGHCSTYLKGADVAKRKKATMSAQHKRALATGRRESKVVRDYLHALEANRPRRGRKRTPDSVKKRLAKIDREIDAAPPLQRLQLTQERMDLNDELDRMAEGSETAELEKQFSKVAKQYSQRKGISYAAWRELGVPAEALRRAGITRGGG